MINSYQINVLVVINELGVYEDVRLGYMQGKKDVSVPNFKTILLLMLLFLPSCTF